MNPEIKERWLQALRSGEYQQGRATLHNQLFNRYCCLGVLCEIAAEDGIVEAIGQDGVTRYQDPLGQGSSNILPVAVANWAGLNSTDPLIGVVASSRLSSINDAGADNFHAIADLIEKHL